ncbi:MAG: alpha/beta fold hydrolase [Curvibacter sp.]|jgi:3-oxoadipate enol-lactonase|nr:alpha/beta hydrolase [Curvibacter sp.]
MSLHQIERVLSEEQGEGEAVVCIHGLGGSSNTFTPLMHGLTRRRVLRIDLPGSARSQRVEGDLTIARYVATVRAACARAAITRADVVGHSMGTIVAQHLAVETPELVRSLALFGPLTAPSDAARAAVLARAAKVRSEGAVGMHEIALTLVQASLSADTRQRLPLAVAFVRESLMRQEAESYARSCEALATASAAALERIACPVLLITGDEDSVAPPQAARAMAGKLGAAPSARVCVLPRCGHWTPVERPDECLRELLDFWSVNART